MEVRTRLDDGQIELTVTDSGIGIDSTFLPYVFDRFRQADASSTRAQSGLGLGLAIVRHLVELHGGSVRAESDGRDAGTRFVVRLPRRHVPLTARDARSPASVSATPAATDVPQFDGLRILIVDDDRESCEMMLEALRRYGASVQCALSATEATARLLEFRPDLVLSDIAMPGRDGYAVLSEVRQVETSARTARASRGRVSLRPCGGSPARHRGGLRSISGQARRSRGTRVDGKGTRGHWESPTRRAH